MRAVAIRNPILSRRNRATGRDGGVAQCIEAVALSPDDTLKVPGTLGVGGQCNAKVLLPICDPTTRSAAAPDGLSRSEASCSANKFNRGRLETDDLCTELLGECMVFIHFANPVIECGRDDGLSKVGEPKGPSSDARAAPLSVSVGRVDQLGCCPSTPTLYGPIDTGTSIRIVCYIMNRIGVVAPGCRGSSAREGG
jgi:hypothetical protein